MAALPERIQLSLNEIFGKYDINKNGTLEKNEIALVLKDVFAKFGIQSKATEEDIANFIKQYDRNHDGKLTMADFESMYALNFYNHAQGQHLPAEISISIDEIFAKYDVDRNGTLDSSELVNCLQDVFNKLGVPAKATQEDVKNFFADYDVNTDHKITREDFKKVYAINFQSH